jgi:hypothetical protein
MKSILAQKATLSLLKMFSDISSSSINDFSIEIESLYIGHVFPNINKKKIAQLFEKLFLANIKGIDFVTKIGKYGMSYNSAYIHIESWFDTTAAKHFQEKIRSNSEALLVYDEPWYWLVNENKSTEKSKFIQKTENEKFEEAQKQANSTISEMLMMLDSLEDIFDKNKKIVQTEYEDKEYEVLREQLVEYINKND